MAATVKIDREKRITLLRWLKAGEIDALELNEWTQARFDEMTPEELDEECYRLAVADGSYCRMARERGQCPLMEGSDSWP